MIIDTSAIIAILRSESGAAELATAIETASTRRMSAVTYVEAAVVMDNLKDPVVSRRFDDFIKEAQVVIEEVTREQAQLAREAFRDFGKGSGHPAKLNFGDCFSYALAKSVSEPLLFKGNDFVYTDIKSALN